MVSSAFDAMCQTSAKERKVEITTERNGDGTVWVSVRDHGGRISAETVDAGGAPFRFSLPGLGST